MEIITDRSVDRAAVIRAAGFEVKVIKLNCSPRCAFEYPDTPDTRSLIAAYDEGRIAAVPHKRMNYFKGILLQQCRDLNVGSIGGV